MGRGVDVRVPSCVTMTGCLVILNIQKKRVFSSELSDNFDFFDNDIFKWYIIMSHAATSCYSFNCINNFHAIDYFSEYGISPTLPARSSIVEK
jgi:hypothetical protein